MAYPISFDGLSNGIHRLRELADKYTPGPGTALSLMGGPLGWMTLGGGSMPQARILNNHKVAAAPQAAPAPQADPSPSVPAMGGLGLFPPQSATPMNWLQSAQQAPPSNPPSPAPQVATPPQTASTPMPQARPAGALEAPQAPPDMGWFARNTAMMRDPASGDFIDPTAAARAQVRGPDLINKMMAYLHNKDLG